MARPVKNVIVKTEELLYAYDHEVELLGITGDFEDEGF